MVDRIPWEKGSKDKDSGDGDTNQRSFLRNALIYGVSVIASAAVALGTYYYLSVKPKSNEAREENSRLTQIVEEKSAERDSLAVVVDSLTSNIINLTSLNEGLHLRLDMSEDNRRLTLNNSELLTSELIFYVAKVDSLANEQGHLNSLLDAANTERTVLEDSVGVLNYNIDVLSEELHGVNSALAAYRATEEASQPQVIKLPGDISTRFNYYLKNGNNAGGLTLSKSLGQSNIIDTAIEGGFNVFEGRDTGQFLGFRLSLDLLERFSWDFGMGPYILKDFSDGAKATLTLYGESGFYFEPFGKVKGLGIRVGIRKLEDRFDYSTAFELGRN